VLVPNAAVVGMNDAVAAGAVLGLSPDAVREQMRRTVPRAGAAETAGGDGEAGPSGPGGTGVGAGGEEDCGSLMARARADRSSLSDEDRTRVRECFQQMGGPRGMRSGAPSGSGETRPAVVFVETEAGPEARLVQLGLNDWDRTQVVSGLEAGEEVILISVAQMRQQQEEIMNRIRQRTSPIPGGR
ncbi:MAG: hypothetical protein R3314_03260, partial [Longimicrobiales bacterium]|nr:hypothetical protein [Longimicrobiales bacterium]